MRRVVVVLGIALAACNGGGDSGSQASNPLIASVQGMLPVMFRTGDAVQQLTQMLLVPSAAAANGIVVVPDTAPGAPPNSLAIHFPLDADGDGTKETDIDGTISLNGSALTAALTMVVDGGDQTLTGTFDFEPTAAALRIFGSGILTDAGSGVTVDFAIDPSNPIVATIAIGEANSVANVCAYSFSGAVEVDAEGPLDSYSARWSFAHDRRSIQVTGASYTDGEGTTTDQPDTTFNVPCDNGTLSDWVGSYDFDWFCFPQESGDSDEFVITITGPNRIHINDDGLEYDATAVPGNPHVVTGFFEDGYREDFVWKLSADGSTFTQQSVYVFEPPATGGGICGGIGIKR